MPPTAATAESAAPPPAKKPRVEKEKSPKEKYQPAPPVPIREIPIKTNGAFERNADRGAPLIPRERWEDMPAWYIQGQDRGPKVVCGDCYGPLVEEKQDGRIYKDCFFCEERPAAGEPILACRKCKWSACQTCDGTSRYVPRLPELEDDSLFHGPNSPAVLVPPAARTCAAAALGTVIVCPGGNYEFLCAHEAFPVAAWLASHGIAAVVLRYRLLPKYGLEEAMDDLEAAVAHVRKTRGGPVGAIGFSAGSHLIASLCRRAGARGQAQPLDAQVLVYPCLDPREWDDGACEDPTLMFFNRGDERYPPRAQSLLTGGEALKGGAGFAAAPNSLLVGSTGDDTTPPKEHLDLYAAACKREGKSFHYIRRNLGGHGFCLNEGGGGGCVREGGKGWTSGAVRWLRANGFGPPTRKRRRELAAAAKAAAAAGDASSQSSSPATAVEL